MPAASGDKGPATASNNDKTQTDEGIIVDRPDLWRMDKCLVCHSKHFSDTAKRRHITTEVHKKRVMVYDFFLNEISLFNSSKASSSIIEHISKRNDAFIGIECLHEFIFSCGDGPFWACSVCYCAGNVVDDVTIHLASNPHRMNYIDEYHPDRKPKGRTAKEIAIELGQATEAIVALQTTPLIPEVIELNMTSQNAAVKLGLSTPVTNQLIEPVATISNSVPSITDQPATVGVRICDPPIGGDEGRLLQCDSCWEVIRVASVAQIEKEWKEHLTTSRHEERARLRQLLSIDKSNDLNEPSQLEENLKYESKNEWEFDASTSAWVFQGQIVGVEYLIERVERLDKFTRAKRDVVCLLCLEEMPIAPISVVQTHVRSESHIVAYLHKEVPTVADEILATSVSNRRELIADYLMANKIGKCKVTVCSGVVKYTEVAVPSRSNQTTSQQSSALVGNDDAVALTCEPKIITLKDGDQAIWCEACWQVLFVPAKSNDVSAQQSCWEEHSRQQSHIDLFIKRKQFDFAEENFVDGISRLTPPAVEDGDYGAEKASTSKSEAFEKQPSVGLDFIIERHRPDESVDAVCLLCAEVMPCNNEIVHRHIQSEQHVVQFLHSSNIPMVKLLNKQQSKSARRKALLDYLKKMPPDSSTFRIYHPRLAAALRQWGTVSAYSLTGALMPEHQCDIFLIVARLIDDVCGPNEGPPTVPVKDALAQEGMKVLGMEDDDILLWCNACWETVVVPAHHSPVDHIWSGHLRSAVHQKKKAQRERLKIDDRYFLKKEKSKFKVADVSTVASSEKKRTWMRDEARGGFDFVYRTVGLNHVIDRRSIDATNEQKSDLFCLMCLRSMPRNTTELTAHVRSIDHVLQYLHRYNPLATRQLHKHPLKGVELRSFITSAVRKVSDGQASFIRVYDPTGVECKQRSPSERPNESQRQSKEALKEKTSEARSKFSKTSNRSENGSSSKASLPNPKVKKRERSEDRAKSSSKATIERVPKSDNTSSKNAESRANGNSSKTAVPLSESNAVMRSDIIKKLLDSAKEEIPDSGRPTKLNESIDATGGCLGANLVYEVVCVDDVYFKSYLCSICSVWEDANLIISHLLTDEHRLAFLNAFYKMNYKAVTNLSEGAKSGALKQYTQQIEQIEGKHEVTRRLRYRLDSLTLAKVWPNYQPSIQSASDPPPPGVDDNSLFAPPVRPDLSERRNDLPPPPGTEFSRTDFRRSASSSASQPPLPGADSINVRPSVVAHQRRRSRRSKSRSRSPNPTAKRLRRSPSPKRARQSPTQSDRMFDGRRSVYNRSPTDDRRRGRRTRSRSRSRSPIKHTFLQTSSHPHPSPPRSPIDRYADLRPHPTTTAATNALSWDQKAAIFLEQIGDRRAASQLFASGPPPNFVATQQAIDAPRIAPNQAASFYGAPYQEREESRPCDSSLNTSVEELLAGLIDSFCTTTTASQGESQQSSQTSSEQLLSSLLKDKRLAATEQLLIKLLIEEREKQKQQDDNQQLLIKTLSQTTEKRAPQTKVVDYGHRSMVASGFDRQMEESTSAKSFGGNEAESLSTVVESKNTRTTASPEVDLVRDAELNAIRARAAAAVATNSAPSSQAATPFAPQPQQTERAEAEKLVRLVQSGAVTWNGLQQLMEKVKKPEPHRPPPPNPVDADGQHRRAYYPFSDYDYVDQPLYKAAERDYDRSRPLPMPAQPQRNADSTAVYPVIGDMSQKWSQPPPPPPLPHPVPPPPSQQQQSTPVPFTTESMSRGVRLGPTAAVFGAPRPPSLMSVNVSNPMDQSALPNGPRLNRPPIDHVTYFSR